jgi:two-component system nitrogen regulation response regulator GlnG
MTEKVRDMTTRVRPETVGRVRPVPACALTIACHQDVGRIGERAVLDALARGRAVRLSRTTPDFSLPGKVLGTPLDDAYVSRTPIVLRSDGEGGVLVERNGSPMGVKVAGEPLGEGARISADRCAAGVDLELGESVALLLHRGHEPEDRSCPGFGLIGESSAIWETRLAVSRVADLEVPVLLRGESGTGKELVARAIHEHGRRRRGPFVAVNLSAVTPSLAAAELFGTVTGAYTGAVARKGFFRAADGGTLFLDEVGECPADVQTMLLRTLETSELYPVGSHTPQRADVRLIAATDSNLEVKARSGAFKEPLLHRLAAYEIWLAPLSERREDIGRLVVHFALEARATTGQPSLRTSEKGPWLPAPLVARLCRYHWPGNVRQLRNVVWQLVVDSRGRDRLEIGPRLERLLEDRGTDEGDAPSAAAAGPVPRRVRIAPASVPRA